jgi:hypothetical protein
MDMGRAKTLCILHGNCQGETLAALLLASPEFNQAFEIRFHVNFTRQAVPAEDLARCGLFLHQHLGEEWLELSSNHLRGQLPKKAHSLCFPNMLFKGYWPFWTSGTGVELADSLLDHLIEQGLGKADILHVALRGDLDAMFGLAGLLEETLAREREKEKSSAVKYVDIIEEGFRREKLFQSVNHPGNRLMLHVADSVLSALGMPPLPQGFKEVCPVLHPKFEMPIHPQVAAFHGLSFAGQGCRFNVYGVALTYAEYMGLYVDCRLAGRGDFINFLHGR